MENSTKIEYKKCSDCPTEVADIVTIDEVNWRLRHSKDKLAKYFVKMDLCRRKD